jgi:predicted transcriptional regulator
MLMAELTRRLQVLLDQQRYARLERLARRRKTSVATLVREAIDVAFPDETISRQAAGRRLLDAEPIEVGDWQELKAEIEGMYEPGR